MITLITRTSKMEMNPRAFRRSSC